MSHTRTVESFDLHALVDDQLEPERRAEVEAWLSEHPDEAAAVAAWRAQNEALRLALVPVMEETVPGRLDPTRLARALPGLRAQERRLPMAAGIAFVGGALAGILMLLVLQQGIGLGRTAAVDPIERLPAMAVDAHRVFVSEVRHPVEVGASEESHLVQWLSKKLGYHIGLPDLGAEGLKLVGGRLLSNAPGAAAFFMFETTGGERITVYCSRLPGTRDTAFRYAEAKGVNTFFWIDDQIGFAVSGPVERERLLRVSRLVFEAMERHPDHAT